MEGDYFKAGLAIGALVLAFVLWFVVVDTAARVIAAALAIGAIGWFEDWWHWW